MVSPLAISQVICEVNTVGARRRNYILGRFLHGTNRIFRTWYRRLIIIFQTLLGHWGSSPGLSFIYVHLSRIIKKYDLNMIFIAGPGHGAPGVLGPTYLEGTYSEIYPEKSQDVLGLREFFQQFSFPRRNR